MKRMLAAAAVAAALLVPATGSATQIPKTSLCPSSAVVTDELQAQFDGYRERALWASIDRQWEKACSL